jgi:hypothetical protein
VFVNDLSTARNIISNAIFSLKKDPLLQSDLQAERFSLRTSLNGLLKSVCRQLNLFCSLFVSFSLSLS